VGRLRRTPFAQIVKGCGTPANLFAAQMDSGVIRSWFLEGWATVFSKLLSVEADLVRGWQQFCFWIELVSSNR